MSGVLKTIQAKTPRTVLCSLLHITATHRALTTKNAINTRTRQLARLTQISVSVIPSAIGWATVPSRAILVRQTAIKPLARLTTTVNGVAAVTQSHLPATTHTTHRHVPATHSVNGTTIAVLSIAKTDAILNSRLVSLSMTA